MFGNPQYFQTKKSIFPKPAKLSGWLFYVLWISAILGPTIAMLAWGQYIQLLVWLVISVSWFSLDSISTSRQIQRKVELDQLFYVGEEDSHVSTENYDLNLRNSSSEAS